MNSNVFKAHRGSGRDRYVKFTLATRTPINPADGQPRRGWKQVAGRTVVKIYAGSCLLRPDLHEIFDAISRPRRQPGGWLSLLSSFSLSSFREPPLFLPDRSVFLERCNRILCARFPYRELLFWSLCREREIYGIGLKAFIVLNYPVWKNTDIC